jgi:hypothetical protein
VGLICVIVTAAFLAAPEATVSGFIVHAILEGIRRGGWRGIRKQTELGRRAGFGLGDKDLVSTAEP